MSQKVTESKPSSNTNKPRGKSTKTFLLKPVDFNPSKFSFTDVQMDNKNSKIQNKNQFIAFPRYNFGKNNEKVEQGLVFRTDAIKITRYGVPREEQKDDNVPAGKQVGPANELDKACIKVPHDETQESCVKLFKMLLQLDEYMIANSSKLFTGALSKFAKMYEYQPIVRVPETPETDDGKTPEKKPGYAKFKFDTEYSTGNITTNIFVREDGVPVLQNVKTVPELRKTIPWNSTVQMIVSANKIWLAKSAISGGKRKFGVTFKVQQIEVTDRPASSNNKEAFKTYMMNDDSDEEEPTVTQTATPVQSAPAKKPVVTAVATPTPSPVVATSVSDNNDEETGEENVEEEVVEEGEEVVEEEAEPEPPKPAPKAVAKAPAKAVAKTPAKKPKAT